MAFRDEFGRRQDREDTRPSVAAAGGARAAAAIDTAVGADVDLQDFAVLGAGKRGKRKATVGTGLVVVVEVAVLDDSRQLRRIAAWRAGASGLLTASSGQP